MMSNVVKFNFFIYRKSIVAQILDFSQRIINIQFGIKYLSKLILFFFAKHVLLPNKMNSSQQLDRGKNIS